MLPNKVPIQTMNTSKHTKKFKYKYTLFSSTTTKCIRGVSPKRRIWGIAHEALLLIIIFAQCCVAQLIHEMKKSSRRKIECMGEPTVSIWLELRYKLSSLYSYFLVVKRPQSFTKKRRDTNWEQHILSTITL